MTEIPIKEIPIKEIQIKEITDIKLDINESIKDEIDSFMKSRKNWRNTGIFMETASKIMIGITSILTFSTSAYPCNIYLSFSAGSIATLSLVTLQFANYSFKESKISTENLNILLKNFNIKVPNVNASVLRHSESPKIEEIINA